MSSFVWSEPVRTSSAIRRHHHLPPFELVPSFVLSDELCRLNVASLLNRRHTEDSDSRKARLLFRTYEGVALISVLESCNKGCNRQKLIVIAWRPSRLGVLSAVHIKAW